MPRTTTKQLIATLMATLIMLCTAVASAALYKPDNLYEASVPVFSEDAELRDEYLKQALAAVLVRLTGDQEIAADPLAGPVLAKAAELVQTFGYSTSRESNPLDPEGPGLEIEQLQFTASFDETSLNEALLAASLPVWGNERPTTALWIAVRDADDSAIVSQSRADTLGTAAIKTSLARGLPVVLPTLPHFAKAGVGIDHLMDGNEGNIVAVSGTLGGQSAAIGRLQRDGAGWQGSWTLLTPDNPPETWDVQGVTMQEVQAQGIHRIADAYAAQFSNLSVSQSSAVTYVTVRGMDSADSYAKVSGYLESLSIVSAADMFAFQGGEVIYRVELNGEVARFEQSVALGQVLERDWNNAGSPGMLNFVLQ